MRDPKAKEDEADEDAQCLPTSNSNIWFPSLHGKELPQNVNSVNDAMHTKAEEAIREAEDTAREEQRLNELEIKKKAREAHKAKTSAMKTSLTENQPVQFVASTGIVPTPPSQRLAVAPPPLNSVSMAQPSITDQVPRATYQNSSVTPMQGQWNQPVLIQTPQSAQQSYARQEMASVPGAAQMIPVPVAQPIQPTQQMHLEYMLQQQLAAHNMLNQRSQPHLSHQGNGRDDDSWTAVEKAKSATLSMFSNKELVVAFKDKGLRGYPPFCVVQDQTELRICFTKFLLREIVQRTSDGKTLFVEFVTMIPPSVGGINLLTAYPPIIPFSSTVTEATTEDNVLISKIKINVPDYYDSFMWQSDDRSLLFSFRKQATPHSVTFSIPSQ